MYLLHNKLVELLLGILLKNYFNILTLLSEIEQFCYFKVGNSC